MAQETTVTVSQEYLEKLEKKVGDLKLLIEVSSIISSTLDFNDLITLVMEKTKNVMDAEACSILIYNRDTNKLEFTVALCQGGEAPEILKDKVCLDMGQGIAGWVAEHRESIIVEDAKSDSRFYKEADKMTGFETRSLVAAPLVGRSGLIGVAEVLNPKKKKSFSCYDTEIFETLCSQVAIAIENSIFHKASIERERFRKELEIASVVQQSFLPETPTMTKGNIKVSAVNISASQVGGDVYDFIDYKSGRIGVLIGDVSGKGVHAALYMAKIISEFRHIAHSSVSPGDTLEQLNTRLSSSPRGMFLTCIYLVVDANTGNVQVSVAGHPPFVKLYNGGCETVTLPSGPPLGIVPSDYPTETFDLRKKERIILLTDGAFDAVNIKGERIGFDRIAGFIKENAGEDNLLQLIVDHVDHYSKDVERADDLTLVEVRKI